MEKNDVPANVERLSNLIDHLKEQERSYLRFLQKMLVSLSFFFSSFGSFSEIASLFVFLRLPDQGMSLQEQLSLVESLFFF